MTELNSHRLDPLEPLDFQPANKKRKATCGNDLLGGWAPTSLKLDEEDHEWWQEFVNNFSATPSQRSDTVGLVSGCQPELQAMSDRSLYPSRTQSFPAYNYHNFQHDDPVEIIPVPDRRHSREDQFRNSEFLHQPHIMKEPSITNQRAAKNLSALQVL